MSNIHAARAAYQRARNEGYAIGAFNIDNQETLIAVARAAQAKKAPVMVEVSAGEVKAMGLKNIRAMVDNYRDEYGIELYINLDHSPSVAEAKAGIDAGFEFIHIDISQANHEASDAEIIAATREVVEHAKTTGALVESEPHYFGGSSNVHDTEIDYEEIKQTFSTPESTVEFIQATGIDTFAVAIGNLHGKYPVPKQLDIELLQRINAQLPEDTYLSLHGGSGTPEHFYQAAVSNGISKVNINSDMRYAFRKTLEAVLNDNPDQYAVVKLMPEVIAAVQAVVEEKIEMFGASGKAVLN
ncbi:MAG: class II fructose-bisphosphate aldolase [Candidatus Saccharimonadales bacterium]